MIYDFQLQNTTVLRTHPHQQGTLTQPFHGDLQRLSCKTQKNYPQRLHKLQLQNGSRRPSGKTYDNGHTLEIQKYFLFQFISMFIITQSITKSSPILSKPYEVCFPSSQNVPKTWLLACCNKSCQGREDHCGSRTGNGEKKIKRCFRFENNSTIPSNSKINWKLTFLGFKNNSKINWNCLFGSKKIEKWKTRCFLQFLDFVKFDSKTRKTDKNRKQKRQKQSKKKGNTKTHRK